MSDELWKDASVRELVCARDACRALERENDELAYLLGCISAAVRGEPVSEFGASFPLVRDVVDLLAELDDLRDLLDFCDEMAEAGPDS